MLLTPADARRQPGQAAVELRAPIASGLIGRRQLGAGGGGRPVAQETVRLDGEGEPPQCPGHRSGKIGVYGFGGLVEGALERRRRPIDLQGDGGAQLLVVRLGVPG